MTDRQALFAAVCAEPAADLPRLVMADHLDEHGEWERAAFIRGHISDPAYPIPADPLVLLDPPDRDLFHLVTFRPLFARGFLTGVVFPDFGVDRYDPPIYPVEEVADDWHRLCDLFARNPLMCWAGCPGWFHLVTLPLVGGHLVNYRLMLPPPCQNCGGEGVVGQHSGCPDCGGFGHAEQSRELFTPDGRGAVAEDLLRRIVARDLFGDDHPLFR